MSQILDVKVFINYLCFFLYIKENIKGYEIHKEI